jgi:hypothetical protein
MSEKPPPEHEGDDWKAAEKALAEARGLKGSQRFEALKRAGQLRYDAHKKRQENVSIKLPGRNDHGAKNEASIDGVRDDGEGT